MNFYLGLLQILPVVYLVFGILGLSALISIIMINFRVGKIKNEMLKVSEMNQKLIDKIENLKL